MPFPWLHLEVALPVTAIQFSDPGTSHQQRSCHEPCPQLPRCDPSSGCPLWPPCFQARVSGCLSLTTTTLGRALLRPGLLGRSPVLPDLVDFLHFGQERHASDALPLLPLLFCQEGMSLMWGPSGQPVIWSECCPHVSSVHFCFSLCHWQWSFKETLSRCPVSCHTLPGVLASLDGFR